MIPWVQLGSATMPGGGGELRLMQRGAEYSIMAGPIELMNSRLAGSETALATLTCDRLQGRKNPHLLIGGLGMGFTLRAALGALGAGGKVTVAELVPELIGWCRGPLAGVVGGSLDDPRTTLVTGDVGTSIRNARAAYDAILLDVDNGPEGLTRKANDRLYDSEGIGAAKRALRPGGVLAVWSSSPNPAFTRRLRNGGYEVKEVKARAHGDRGARHIIWIAVSPA